VLHKFVSTYNDTVHTTTGIAPSKVTDSDILNTWKRMNARRLRIPSVKVKFHVGEHVRISKEKMRFAKARNRILAQRYFELIRSFIEPLDP